MFSLVLDPLFGVLSTVPLIIRVPLVLVLCLALLIWIWTRRIYKTYDWEKFMRLPGPKPWPIIGNLDRVVGKPTAQLMQSFLALRSEYRPVMRLLIGPYPRASIMTAPLMKAVLTDPRFNKGEQIYRLLEPWLGKGLVTTNGAQWHARRKLLTPAFHFQILQDFVPIINRKTRVLVDEILPGLVSPTQAVDIIDIIKRYTLDVICESAMGKNLDLQQDGNTEYTKAIHSLTHCLMKRVLSPLLRIDALFSRTKIGVLYEESLKVVHNFTDRVVKSQREQDSSETKRLAFLDLMMRASNDGHALSDKDIRDEVNTMLFAGHDTTSTSISFTLYALASHPDCQRKVVSELRDIFGDDDERDITPDDMAKMKYLSSCIKEAMRLYPTVPLMSRTSKEDIMVEGYLFPANVEILIHLLHHHRDPETFPNPTHYDPNRFFIDANVTGRHPFAFIPFSAGARNCIGQKFAEMEQKIALATILRKYHVRTDLKPEVVEHSLVYEFTLKAETGLPLCFDLRRRSTE